MPIIELLVMLSTMFIFQAPGLSFKMVGPVSKNERIRSEICVPWFSSVEVTGRVEIARVFGPPNYGDTPATDAEYLVHRIYPLDHNYCITVEDPSDVFQKNLYGVKSMQVTYVGEVAGRQRLSMQSGLCYKIEGVITPSMSAPLHFEQVLLEGSNVSPCKKLAM